MARARTPFLSQFAYGVLERIIADAEFAPGNVFFLDNSNTAAGTSTKHGESPDTPFSTLAAAVDNCTASKNDVILALPGHAQTIEAAAGEALDVAGAKLIGVSNGRLRPTFTLDTAAAASFDISAANCLVQNVVFIASEDCEEMINLTAANITLRNCEIVLATTGKEAVIGILASANADRFLIEDCFIHDIGVAGCDHAISFGACDHAIIRNNYITGLFATGGLIENSAAAVDVLIEGNKLLNRTPDGANKILVADASTTGLISNNRMAIIDSCCVVPITAAAMFVSGNYFTGAAGVTASTLK